MEVKVHCKCGQRYRFAAEPVDDKLPVPVSCPACGADGTVEANSFIKLARVFETSTRRKGKGGTEVMKNPSQKRPRR